TREARPGEVDVAVASAAGAVSLDGRLVVELAQQIGRRRSGSHQGRSLVEFAVIQSVAGFTAGILETRYPGVAKCLFRAGRIVGTLRPKEHAAVTVPRDYGIACARGSDACQCRERGFIARISGHEGTAERRAAVLRPIVAKPDRSGGVKGSGRSSVDAAIVVGTADQHACVAWIYSHGRLVLTPSRDRALIEYSIGIGNACRERVSADVTASHVVAQTNVRRGKCQGKCE